MLPFATMEALELKPSVMSYRSYLRSILIEKQKKNPSFSQGSLARLIGIQSSHLSMVLSGKRDLSEDIAHKIVEKLSLNTIESKKFILQLRLEKSGSALVKEQILQELNALLPAQNASRDLTLDEFKMISEWYHFPLQILIQLEDYPWSEEWAAKSLGITTHEVIAALERMQALEVLDWKMGERPRMMSGRLSINSPFKNDALRKYHTQMLQKNIEALQDQEPAERFTGSMNLALDESQLKEAHRILDEAMSRLRVLADQKAKSKKVYHANLNVFRISKNLNVRGKK